MQKVKIIILILLIHIQSIFAIDSQSFKVEKRNEEKQFNINLDQRTLVEKNSTKKQFTSFDEISETIYIENLKKIENFNLLLSKEKSEQKIILLKLNSMISHMQIGRYFRFKSGGKKILDDELKHLNAALDISIQIIKREKIDKVKLAYVNYLQGMIYLDLNRSNESRNSFIRSIELDSNAKFSIPVSIYLADMLYDESNLDLALAEYDRFYLKMKQDEKDLVDYKKAWILLNKSKLEEAKKIFSTLMFNSKSSNIANDSLQSLAVLLGEQSTEQKVIEYFQLHFTKIFQDEGKNLEYKEKQKKLLWSIYLIFQNDLNRSRKQIFNLLLKLENNPSEKIRLWLYEVKNARILKNIEKQNLYFANLIKSLPQSNNFENPIVQPFLEELEYESENIISVRLDEYLNNKNVETFRLLGDSLEFHLNFKKSKKIKEILNLYLDLISESENKHESIQKIDLIIKNYDLTDLKQKGLIVKIDLLSELLNTTMSSPSKIDTTNSNSSANNSPTPNNNYYEMLLNSIEEMLKYKNHQDWNKIAQKKVNLLLKGKKYNEGLNVLETMFVREASDDIKLQVASILFENNMCEQILDNKVYQFHLSQNEKILSYFRECELKTAISAKNDPKLFDLYEKNIVSFIKKAPNEKKIKAVADYLNTLDSKNETNKIVKLLQSDFINFKFDELIYPLVRKIGLNFMDHGQWSLAQQLFSGCVESKFCKEAQISVQYTLFAQDIYYLKKNVQQIEQQQKKYFSSVLALVDSARFLKLFQNDDHLDDEFKKLLFIASKLTNINLNDKENAKLRKTILKYVPINSGDDVLNLKSYIHLKKVKWPNDIEKHNLSDKQLANIVETVQSSRNLVKDDIKSLSIQQKKILLEIVIKAESNVSKVILNSQLPKNLNDSQSIEYKESLNQLSQEFINQSQEYSKILQALLNKEEQIKQSDIKSKLRIPIQISTWFAQVKNETVNIIIKELELNKFISAMLILDSLFAQKKIIETDYYFLRTGIILFSHHSELNKESIVIYLYDELKLLNQESVILRWQNIK